jgi:DNA-binding CsgD family transcriptional regulator
VSRLVALRLARLPPDAVGLARALAILGDQTDLARAAALARVDVDRLDLAAEALSTSGLVARQAPLEFSHPIVRSAVLDGIGAVGRARLHREAAALLGGAGARPELVAAHLLQVPPAGDPFVVDALRRAAIGALAQGSADSATVYLTRALREGSAVGRAELLFELGSAELRTSATDAAGHLSEALAESGDLGTRPDVALALVHSLDLLARADDAFALLERLSAALPPDARDLRWAVEARLAAAGHQSPERHGSASRRLGEIDLDLVGSGSGAGMLLAVAALDEAHRGVDRARTIELAERACGSSLRDAPGERLWLLRAFQSLLFAGRAGQAANGLAEAIRTAQEEGDLLTLTAFQVFSALLRLHVGDLRGAEEDLQPLAPDAFRGLATFSSYRNAFLAQILLERGMTDEAVALFADDPGPAVEGYRIGFLLSRSSAYLSASRADEAAADALAAGDIAKAIGSGNPAATPWRSRAARALHRSGRTEEAVGLAREEVARAERWGAPAPLGVALGTLGLVEGGSSGERLLREAVLKLVDSPARLEHARALVELGAALRRANHRSEARDRLRQGVDLAQALGATALATRGNEEIAATGARPRKQLVTGLDALTASERRVAQLAAEGMTNKEIAQALFVTVKTVELHLSSSYRKLDIRSRGQLATVLA